MPKPDLSIQKYKESDGDIKDFYKKQIADKLREIAFENGILPEEEIETLVSDAQRSYQYNQDRDIDEYHKAEKILKNAYTELMVGFLKTELMVGFLKKGKLTDLLSTYDLPTDPSKLTFSNKELAAIQSFCEFVSKNKGSLLSDIVELTSQKREWENASILTATTGLKNKAEGLQTEQKKWFWQREGTSELKKSIKKGFQAIIESQQKLLLAKGEFEELLASFGYEPYTDKMPETITEIMQMIQAVEKWSDFISRNTGTFPPELKQKLLEEVEKYTNILLKNNYYADFQKLQKDIYDDVGLSIGEEDAKAVKDTINELLDLQTTLKGPEELPPLPRSYSYPPRPQPSHPPPSAPIKRRSVLPPKLPTSKIKPFVSDPSIGLLKQRGEIETDYYVGQIKKILGIEDKVKSKWETQFRAIAWQVLERKNGSQTLHVVAERLLSFLLKPNEEGKDINEVIPFDATYLRNLGIDHSSAPRKSSVFQKSPPKPSDPRRNSAPPPQPSTIMRPPVIERKLSAPPFAVKKPLAGELEEAKKKLRKTAPVSGKTTTNDLQGTLKTQIKKAIQEMPNNKSQGENKKDVREEEWEETRPPRRLSAPIKRR